MLSREEILSKNDLKKEVVTVPEWGGDVYVSEMTGEARDAWEQGLISKDESRRMKNIRARLVCATVVDETGKRLFTDSDDEAVGKLSAYVLDKLCKTAQKLNGLTSEELKEAEGN